MNTEEIVRKVLLDALKNSAKRQQVKDQDVQLVLFLEKENKLGITGLLKYKAVNDKYELGSLLGIYFMFKSAINDFICKALVRLGNESNIPQGQSKALIMCDEKDTLKLWLLNDSNPVKEIQAADILKE